MQSPTMTRKLDSTCSPKYKSPSSTTILDIVTQTSENSEPSERHANGAESEVEVRKKAYCSCT
jgi:hypothetical protein